MHEPSIGGTDGELVVPSGDIVSPGGASAPDGPNPPMSEAAGCLPYMAGPMGILGIGSGLPTERGAAR